MCAHAAWGNQGQSTPSAEQIDFKIKLQELQHEQQLLKNQMGPVVADYNERREAAEE